MATNRSRRLRKKLCVAEFQELGCELTLNFKADLDDAAVDAFLEAFGNKPTTIQRLRSRQAEVLGQQLAERRVHEIKIAVAHDWILHLYGRPDLS